MSAKTNQKDASALLNDMSRHEAIAYLVNTAIQIKHEGLPIEVAHQDDEIVIFIKGFVVNDAGDILPVKTEPEATPT